MAILRIGIIGLGKISQVAHLPHFARANGCRIAAVASKRERVGRAAQRQYAVPRYYDSWHELATSSEVDAVAVCTQNHSHAEIALTALRHGKHVLVEKPIATSRKDAARMIAAARSRGLLLAVNHHLRFDPVVIAARRIVVADTIGDIVGFEAVFCHRGPLAWSPRARWFFDPSCVGGGVLMDLGVHAFDLVPYLLQRAIETIEVRGVGTGRRDGGPAEHHAGCLVGLRGGGAGTITLSWRDAIYRNHWYLVGTRGTLAIDLAEPRRILLHRGRSTKRIVLPAERSVPTAQQAFVAAIRGTSGNADAGLASGEDGLAALALTLRASARLQGARAFPQRRASAGPD